MANADGPNPRLLSELLLNFPEAKIAISIASEAPIEVRSPRGGGAAAALKQSPPGRRVGRWVRRGSGTQRVMAGARTRQFGTQSPDPQPQRCPRISNSGQRLSLPGDLGGRADTWAPAGLRRTVLLLRAACRTRALPCPHLRARRWKSSVFAVGIAKRWLETAHV